MVQSAGAAVEESQRVSESQRVREPQRVRAVRALSIGFTGFAVTTAAWLGTGDSGAVRGSVAVFLAVLGAASLVLGLLYGRRPIARQILIGVHFPLIVILFVLSIVAGSSLLLLGVALSVVILAALRPRFRRMRPHARKFWLTLHVGFSVGWLGAGLGMVVLSLVGATTSDLALRHSSYELMHIFDLTLVIPLVLLSISTGLVVSLGTQWGLIKHWWVLIKFGISIGIVAVAAVWENFLVRGLATDTGIDPAVDAAGRDWQLAGCMLGFVIALWVATTLSVTKPGGRTRWGKRDRARGWRHLTAPGTGVGGS
ncbi:MAG: hypothetical protein ACREX8_10600 [Gammaproteobacteria bacterium]